MNSTKSLWASVILIWLVILFANFIPGLYTNEEQYLSLAKQFMDPSWIPGSFCFEEFPGTRLFFQYIVGSFLLYFDLEDVSNVGKIINYLMYAIPLALIFRRLQLPVIVQLLIVLIYSFNQSFFAGEWIMKGFEVKTVAYIFIFWALYFWLEKQFIKVTLFTLIAAHFHVLVGGWFFAVFMVWMLLFEKNIKQLFLNGILFGLLFLPFFIYLYKGVFGNHELIPQNVDVDWVYAYYRNTKHVGFLQDWKTFSRTAKDGVLISTGALSLAIYLFFRYKKAGKSNFFLNIFILFNAQTLLFLIVGLFDPHGHIMKYYPFRQSGLAVFTFIIGLMVWMNEQGYFEMAVKQKFPMKKILIVVFVLLFATRMGMQAQNFTSGFWHVHLNEPYHQLYSWVELNTNPKAVFLLINTPENNDHLYFSRKTRRDRFAVEKLVPAGGLHLAEWYLRMLEKEAIEKDINHLSNTLQHYKIDYIVSYKRKVDLPYLEEVFNNKVFYVYKTHEP